MCIAVCFCLVAFTGCGSKEANEVTAEPGDAAETPAPAVDSSPNVASANSAADSAADRDPALTDSPAGITIPDISGDDPDAAGRLDGGIDPQSDQPGTGGQVSGGIGGPSLTAPSDSSLAGDAETTPQEPEYEPYAEKSPLELAAEKAFSSPVGGTRLAPDARLWLDAEKRRLIVDGYVSLSEGPLEMFACPAGTKEHESVVAVLSQSKHIHAGLLALGAVQGTPVSFVPEYRPATGQRIAIWVLWRDAQGMPQKAKAQSWVQQTGTEKELDQDWVFGGSSFWRDPESGREFYQADSGDLICVSNFSTATLDLPAESSQSSGSLVYSAFAERVPPRGTPVRLVMLPIPLPTDAEKATEEAGTEKHADPKQPPEDELVVQPAG
ncbi:YdjY domain-containing protein [Planctomycetaceae bacterium SH139]